mgnify:CR=1 FL=1
MTTKSLFVPFLLCLFSSCRINSFFCSRPVHIKNEQGHVYTSKSLCYYNVFHRKQDSVSLFDINSDYVETPITTILKIKKGRGMLQCFVLDTVKFQECEIIDKRINGTCVRLYAPYFKDTFKVGEFRNNRLNGTLKYYGPSGALFFHVIYKNGKLVKKFNVPD